jgi:hypothetical protein
MGTQLFYKPGSFYRICERTGFAERAERTQKEWTGRIVRDLSWEPRQPQDFVRGIRDNQIAPDPRPRQPNVFLQLETTVAVFTPRGSTSVLLTSAAGMFVGDRVGLLLDGDKGVMWFATIATIVDQLVGFSGAPITSDASSGNLFIDYSSGGVSASSL